MGKSILKTLNDVYEGWTPEFRFDSTNRYRFDFANLKLKIAVEIEGGVWSGGGHTRGKGYIKDMAKYNLAQLKGWMVLRYTYGQEDLITNDIKRAVEIREKERIEKEKLIEKEKTAQN